MEFPVFLVLLPDEVANYEVIGLNESAGSSLKFLFSSLVLANAGRLEFAN